MSNAHSKPIQYEYVMFRDGSYRKVPRQVLIKEIEALLPTTNNPSDWRDEEVNTAIAKFLTKPKSEQVEEVLAMFIKRCEETCPPWTYKEGTDPVDAVVGWLIVGFSETLACTALGEVDV